MMRLKTIIIILTSLVIAPLFAQQYTPVEDVDKINKHKELLHKDRPHLIDKLEIEGVYQINDHHTKIEFHEDGVYNEAIVNSDRKDLLLVATFREIPKVDLPKIINKAWEQSDFGKWNLKKTYQGKTPYGDSFYAIDIQNDKEIKRLLYTDLGRYKEPLY